MGRRLRFLIASTLVTAAAFSAGVWLSARQAADQHARVEGLLWPDPPVLRPFHLVDQDSRPFGLDELRGHWSLLFFGFTHCPDVCPTALAALADAQHELRDHPRYGDRGQVVFVSVDPERDSLETIGDYVAYFSGDFIGATASAAELRDLTGSLGALFAKIPQPGGDYTVDHSAGIYFISPDLHLMSVLTPPHSAAAIVERFDAVSAFVAEHG